MSIVKLKRSGVTGSPTTLAQGEAAYSYLAGTQSNGGDRLYIGTGTEVDGAAANIEVIGGKYFTAKLDHVPGVLTSNSAIITDANNKIDSLNIGNISFTGSSSTISSSNVNGDIVFDLSGTGTLGVKGSAAKISGNSAISIFQITDSLSSPLFSVQEDGTINARGNTITNLAEPVANSDAVTLGYLENTFTAELSITDGTTTDVVDLLTDTLDILGGTGVTSTVANNSVTLSIGQPVGTTDNVTFNDVTVGGSLYSNDITASEVVISGNLTVEGTTTTINTETINLADNIIVLNGNLGSGTAPTQNAGFEIERGSAVNKQLVWDEAVDKWSFGAETVVATQFEGNASTATVLETARNFSLTGTVIASAISFDGSGNVALSTSIPEIDGGTY